MSRGWAEKDWRPEKESPPLKPTSGNKLAKTKLPVHKSHEPEDIENLTNAFQQKADLNSEANSSFSVCDVSTQSMVGMPAPDSQASSQPAKKERKIKIREVKQEVQTVKTRLDSPTEKKMRRKKNSTAEPTMTFHSKAATNDIYDMFNQPLDKPVLGKDDTQSDAEFTEDDGYSTAGESTGTGRVSAPSSEFGDETLASIRRGHSHIQSGSESVSPWSEFTASKHVPQLSSPHISDDKENPSSVRSHRKHQRPDMSDDMTESVNASSQNHTQNSGMGSGFDTQAIAAIAGGNFDEMDTKAIAMIAGDVDGDVVVDDTVDGSLVDAGRASEVASAHDADPPIELGAPATGRQQDFVIYADEDVATPVENESPGLVEIQHKPRYVPLPPVDYEPTPARAWRDPDMVAQNKMPFMTPIAERTESTLAASTIFKTAGYFDSKTPSTSKYNSPSKIGVEDLLLSSPHSVATPSSDSPAKRKHKETGATEDELISSSPRKKNLVGRLVPGSSSPATPEADDSVFKTPALPLKSQTTRSPLTKAHKGPIIPDLQCNPCDDVVRKQILTTISPPLSAQKGFFDHSSITSGQHALLKSFADKKAKTKVKASPRKSQNEKTLTKAVPPLLKFDGTTRVYAVKRELGEGAFAPVYLVDSYDPSEAQEVDENDKENKSPPTFGNAVAAREPLEALKTEAPPGTLVWEFHILRTVKQRLGSAARTMQSIVLAHECHLFHDEAFIILQYSSQGTLLDLINAARTESLKAGKPAEGVDEMVAMWFGVELLRTVEDLHRIGVLHGDLKGDNCLVRFNTSEELVTSFDAEGNHGWSSRGLKLIDFGRGIDTRMFKSSAQFIADWASCAQDCAEIRECRPWKWQIDYHGAAGIIHSLLFGKYIETVPTIASSLGPGQKKEWKLKESFKRYWEKDIWTDVFSTLLNPGSVEDDEEMPIQGNLKRLRMRMENYLVEEGERGGRDLRGSLRRMERLVCK